MTLKISRLRFSGEAFQFHIQMSGSRFVLSLVLVLISLFQDSAESYKQEIPELFTKKLQTGEESFYVCCAKRNGTIWFRWGLYLQGSNRDPVPLYSRALINGSNPLEHTWSRDFHASKYRKRVAVTYNPKSLCMTWKISRVRQGDDNTFFGVYRDEPGLGKQFRPCAKAMKLDVMEIPTRSSSSNPTPLEQDTTPTKKESHLTTMRITGDAMEEDTEDPPETSTEEPNNISDWIIPCAVGTILLLAVLIGSRYKKICEWYNSRAFKDRATKVQEMAGRSFKKIRRRRR